MALLLPLLLPLHAAATVAMAGALWVVQLAIYPHFDAVGRGEFAAYHRRYARGISGVVVPLMAVEAATAVALLLSGMQRGGFLASLVLLGGVWASTFLVQVPLHRRLAAGYEAAVHQRLVRSNWLRTGAWTARAVLVLALMRQ